MARQYTPDSRLETTASQEGERTQNSEGPYKRYIRELERNTVNGGKIGMNRIIEVDSEFLKERKKETLEFLPRIVKSQANYSRGDMGIVADGYKLDIEGGYGVAIDSLIYEKTRDGWNLIYSTMTKPPDEVCKMFISKVLTPPKKTGFSESVNKAIRFLGDWGGV